MEIKNKVRIVILALILLIPISILISSAVYVPAYTVTIEAADSNNATPIQGAKVSLYNVVETSQKQQCTTSNNGKCVFRNVAPGDYGILVKPQSDEYSEGNSVIVVLNYDVFTRIPLTPKQQYQQPPPRTNNDGNYNWIEPLDVLEKAFANAGDEILRIQGENLFKMIGIQSSDQGNIIPEFLSNPNSNNDIIHSNTISKTADMTAWFLGLIFRGYILIGGIVVIWHYIFPDRSIAGVNGAVLSKVQFLDNNYLDLETFVTSIFIGIIVLIFADPAILLNFKFESAIAGELAKNTIYTIPSYNVVSGTEVLGLAISQVAVAAFAYYRYIVISGVLAFRYIILICVMIPYLRDWAIGIAKYTAILLYGRIIILGIALVDMYIITEIGGSFLAFLVLDYIISAGCIVLIVFPVLGTLYRVITKF